MWPYKYHYAENILGHEAYKGYLLAVSSGVLTVLQSNVHSTEGCLTAKFVLAVVHGKVVQELFIVIALLINFDGQS